MNQSLYIFLVAADGFHCLEGPASGKDRQAGKQRFLLLLEQVVGPIYQGSQGLLT